MIGDVLRRNPRVRLLAASLVFLDLSCAAAGFLGVFVGPGLVADWSAEPTSIPDDASASGFSIVTVSCLKASCCGLRGRRMVG